MAYMIGAVLALAVGPTTSPARVRSGEQTSSMKVPGRSIRPL